MSSLFGDFQGKSNFGPNLLSPWGFRLEREDAQGNVASAAGCGVASELKVVQNTTSCIALESSPVYDDINSPRVSEVWQFRLCDDDRYLEFMATGASLPYGSKMIGSTSVSDRTPEPIRSIRHAMYATPRSTTGFFNDGVVQIKEASISSTHFGSISKLGRTFFLGETGSIDIHRPDATGGETDQTVLLNSKGDVYNFASGFQEILVGNFLWRDAWVKGSTAADIDVCSQAVI
jgi:hypothetical protein